jgi:hypothetical protein
MSNLTKLLSVIGTIVSIVGGITAAGIGIYDWVHNPKSSLSAEIQSVPFSLPFYESLLKDYKIPQPRGTLGQFLHPISISNRFIHIKLTNTGEKKIDDIAISIDGEYPSFYSSTQGGSTFGNEDVMRIAELLQGSSAEVGIWTSKGNQFTSWDGLNKNLHIVHKDGLATKTIITNVGPISDLIERHTVWVIFFTIIIGFFCLLGIWIAIISLYAMLT